jgi:hypothetical protein
LAYLLNLSCGEQLPQYLDPRDLLSGTIDGIYILDDVQNVINVIVRLRNEYDEELEGVSAINGTIEIVSRRNPAVRKTITVTPAMIVSGQYNQSTGRLRMVPGGELRFQTSWDLVDDNGMDLKSQFLILLEDSTCPFRCIAVPEDFTLASSMKLFDRISTLSVGPVEFSLCYASIGLGPPTCPPLRMLAPCYLRTPAWPPC